jgi:Coenzyme PQQ synthesis protein D (PqqD)
MAAWSIDKASVSSDCLEGEVIAIHLGTGIYYSLRGTAAALWQELREPADAATLARSLLRTHEVGPEQAEHDSRAFLELLQGEALLAAIDLPPSPPPAAAVAGGRSVYSPPRVERFADLQDLLLMDPIHDVGAQGWPNRPASAKTP